MVGGKSSIKAMGIASLVVGAPEMAAAVVVLTSLLRHGLSIRNRSRDQDQDQERCRDKDRDQDRGRDRNGDRDGDDRSRSKSRNKQTTKLVLVRHGESTWNQENRFTGWYDADLSDKGVEEAKTAAQAIKDAGIEFDIAYTSVLKRAVRTLSIIMDETEQTWIPVVRTWRLNERHYGALTGLDKSETASKHGEEQVKIWRRSYDCPPPPMDKNHPHYEAIAKVSAGIYQ